MVQVAVVVVVVVVVAAVVVVVVVVWRQCHAVLNIAICEPS